MWIHNLVEEDRELFLQMENNYSSDNEKEFFEKIKIKQQTELTIAHDLILHENNNDDGIYIVRCEYEEYIVGQRDVIEEQHVMCLFEALTMNLKEVGLLDVDITLHEWLRSIDYKGVEYDHNYDKI